MSNDSNYGFGAAPDARVAQLPTLGYQPRKPRTLSTGIGLLGCGGITEAHLTAYRKAGYNVVAFCDLVRERAEQRRDKFYPNAKVCANADELLALPTVEVVDIATHPDARVHLIETALLRGKHVLSQKPFCLDLEMGERLVRLARERKRLLAVNQNGRWAPHWSYMRAAVRHGLVGRVESLSCTSSWDHNWVVGTPFDTIRHLLLYDFAIHWFDICTVLFGYRRANRVFAAIGRYASQRAQPPLCSEVVVEYDEGHAVFAFNGNTRFGGRDSTTLVGDRGTIYSTGPNLNEQTLTIATASGTDVVELSGSWFPDGFHGTMAELLCAIEDGREPENAAATNLTSLQLAFAAIHSAETGLAVAPADVTFVDSGCRPIAPAPQPT